MNVPNGWSEKRFREVFRESSEINGLNPVGQMLSVSGYRGIEVKRYDDESRRRTIEEIENYRVVRAGQLVVNTMWLNYAGLGVSPHDGHVSPAYRSYGINEQFEGRYVNYLMRCSLYVDQYTALLTGIRPNSLQMSRNDLMNFRVLVPPRGAQCAIADYLDRETVEIGAFIADQEELIALLEERRRSAITELVTQSFGAGEWRPTTIGRTFNVLDCKHITAETGVNGGYPLASIREVGGEFVNLESARLTTRDFFEVLTEGGRQPRYGDLIVSRNASVGKVAMVPAGLPDFALGQDVSLIRQATGEAQTDFLRYVLRSAVGTSAFEKSSIGSTFKRINVDDIKAVRYDLPDVSTQRARVGKANEVMPPLDASIADAREAIAHLNERRAALISAAVTGQIDVTEKKRVLV